MRGHEHDKKGLRDVGNVIGATKMPDELRYVLVDRLCDVMLELNPQFKADLFEAACGVYACNFQYGSKRVEDQCGFVTTDITALHRHQPTHI